MLLCQSPVLSGLPRAPPLSCCAVAGGSQAAAAPAGLAPGGGGALLLAEGSRSERGLVLPAVLRAPHTRSVFPGGCRLEREARPGHPGSFSTVHAAFRFQNLASP